MLSRLFRLEYSVFAAALSSLRYVYFADFFRTLMILHLTAHRH